MKNDYIAEELKKIFESKEFKAPLDSAMACAWIIAHFKGVNLKVLDLRNVSAFTDFFVIGSASNPTQGRAMAGAILTYLKPHHNQVISSEGMNSADWILLDYGDIVIHIFEESLRDIYDLDGLWLKNPRIPIPESYYTHVSDASFEVSKIPSEEDYF
ncbi:MAG: ribosome silencing factor [Bacteriovoracaceae bacterium]|nr:ribosome silencing factor [Bacteriovoracaceae bacterium]